MKVYGVEYQFDGNIIFIYYTADTRIDYRSFVYDLVKECKNTRVKMKKTNQCRKFIPKVWATQALITGNNSTIM
jgi:cell fate regulator YaaT (PSP1 superfamily)